MVVFPLVLLFLCIFLLNCVLQLMLSHRLLQSASPGTFHILPILTRSLEKLHRVIDQEMYSIGAQKLIMPCLSPKHLWDSSGNNTANDVNDSE